MEVADTGIGIEEKNLARIFDEYFQENRRAIKVQEGAGIGLALSAGLAKLMNGKTQNFVLIFVFFWTPPQSSRASPHEGKGGQNKILLHSSSVMIVTGMTALLFPDSSKISFHSLAFF